MEKTKKSFKIVLPIFIVLALLLSIFSFAGCGTDVGTLNENINKMNQNLLTYSEFIEKNEGNLNTRDYYTISYGKIVDGLVGNTENYDELYKYYNSIFSLAMSYIDENIDIVANLPDEEMNDETKKQLDDLNQKIVNFNNGIQGFVSARNQLSSYFNNYTDSAPDAYAKLSELRSFKSEYGKFVNNAVEISLSLSSAVSATGDLDETDNVMLIKNSICNKILGVFHKFFVMNIGSFNWAESTENELKARIDLIISNLETNFEKYISLCHAKENFQTLTIEDIAVIKKEAENFLTEVDDYYYAIDKLNLKDLSVNHYNDLDEYLEKNQNAEVYLEKIEQFVKTNSGTLATYLEHLEKSVISDATV